MQKNWLAELGKLLPSERFVLAENERATYAGDKWSRGPVPEIVVRPKSTAEVQTLLIFANENLIPVTTRGGGWGYVGGAVTNFGGILLSLDDMNHIREISRGDFVAVVEAGVVTLDLQNAVREQGLFYPPDPASSAHSTLGGNIATNAGGPRCLKYGVTRSYVLGLEVVLADGILLQLGGRIHKNKTGFDLLGLFVGSEGMLGVVTGATLRLLPQPAARAGLAALFPDLEMAAAAVRAIFDAGHLPAALEVANEATLRYFRRAHADFQEETSGAHLLVEVDGQIEGVRAEIAQLESLLRANGAQELQVAADETTVEALWETRRGFSLALTDSGLTKLNEDIVVPRGRLVDLVKFGRELSARHEMEVACFGHAGDGNIHVNLLIDNPDGSLESAYETAQPALDELFAQVLAWGGTITGEHGIGLAKKRWWPSAVSPEVLALHEKMKATLDPNGILNPGKWL